MTLGSPDSCKIVRDARWQGKKVKAVGCGHSFSDVAAVEDGGIILDISSMSNVLEVDERRCRITVEAGMNVADLCEILDSHGWALANIGVIKSQTVAGLLATASHGRYRVEYEGDGYTLSKVTIAAEMTSAVAADSGMLYNGSLRVCWWCVQAASGTRR